MSITRDTRPVDPEDQVRRQALHALAQGLRQLHSALLEGVKKEYEAKHGDVGGPFKLFQLVTQDPHFAWLRSLSSEMALIDERIDDKTKLQANDMAGVRQAVEMLLENKRSAFGKRFQVAIKNPVVIAKHKEVQVVLDDMPAKTQA